MAADADLNTRDEVRRVLQITLALNVLVAAGKIVIGLVSGALAITADGFHSLVDGSSNVVALVANRLAARPPDEDHPYGHRRYETLAALGIGAFLLLTAWEIVSGALARISGGGQAPDITPLTFAVMIGALVVNLFVTTYETRAGRRLKSELLLADAAHTRTDVFVTLSVLASMAGTVLLGWTWLDPAAALVIVALIVRAAWHILRQTGGVLVDTAPYSAAQLETWVSEVPAVTQVLRARSRGPADAAHIDIDVQVPPQTTADHTAAIAQAIRDKLDSKISGIAEVEVHFAPRSGVTDYALAARAQADALGLATHEVHVAHGPNGKTLEMHVEVPPGETLSAAHDRVSQLEQQVKAALGDVQDVLTHIEPAQTHAQPVSDPHLLTGCAGIEAQAMAHLLQRFPHADWHDPRTQPVSGGYSFAAHVTLPPQISVEAAHRLAEEAELLLRTRMPQLVRVTLHTEPAD